MNAAVINGIYDPTDELSGGMPVYAKRRDANVCVEYWPAIKKWQVKGTRVKGSNVAWAALLSDPPVPPEQVVGSVWRVAEGSGFVEQEGVKASKKFRRE